MDGRRYTEGEVEAILALATSQERSDSALTRGGREGGLTLAELRSIAAEAGIDAHALELAAARLDGILAGAGADSGRALLMTRLEGELDEEATEDVADYLRRLLGRSGTRQDSARGFTITFQALTGPRYVTVRNRKGGTEVEVEQNLKPGGMVHSLLVGSVIGMVVIGVIEGSGLPDAMTVLGIPAGILGGWVSLKTWWAAIARRKRAELGNVLRRVEQEVARLLLE